ncbi:MAG: AmmeMemoRadiSam system protein B [Elusimicrobiota bacterium]
MTWRAKAMRSCLAALWLLVSPACAGPQDDAGVRPSALAGSWYLGDAAQLRNRLELYLERAGTPELDGRPLALISPHAGYRYSGQAAAYGFKALRGRGIKRVVIMGLSHSEGYDGASVPGFTHYETPLGKVKVDRAAIDKLRKHPLFSTRPSVHRREHSLEIQLPFLQVVLDKGFSIVPVAFGNLAPKDYPEAARAIREILDDETVIVASSDFMHYGSRFGYMPFKKEAAKNIAAYDMQAVDAILAKDFKAFYARQQKTGNTICGRVPIGVLLHLLGEDAHGTLARYYRSGELTGQWDGSVSYVSAVFTAGKKDAKFAGAERDEREKAMLSPAEQERLLILARSTVDSYVRRKQVPDTKVLSAKVKAGLEKTRGVFVTLKKHGQLRGCIGSIVGREPLVDGVVRNAVNACSFDHRFQPVTPDELKDIELEVSVLSPLRKVSGYDRIIPGWHGVLLTKGRRQAVFLPQVAMEFNWEIEETLTQLARKAGLPSDGWKEGAEFEVFEAQIIPE